MRREQAVGIAQQSVEAFRARVLQPLLHGSGETHFFAMNDFIWQQALGGFLQNVLGGAVANLEVIGNGSGELD